MFNGNLYDDYTIDFSEDYSKYDECYCFLINSKREIYLEENNIPIVSTKDLDDYDSNFILYIGTYKNKPCLVVNINTEDNFISLYDTYDIDPNLYRMISRAILINDWYKSHQYCGNCGTKTVVDKKDMMMLCPKCGQLHYSRIAPAIIVAINNNGKLLMAKHSYHKNIRYALVAGFIEAGESVEEAVHREVMEEIGIKIKNIQYIESQSWPFPNSLMLGFMADYDSGEICVDGDEILDAKWFDVDDIEVPNSNISISSFLIKKFIEIHKS